MGYQLALHDYNPEPTSFFCSRSFFSSIFNSSRLSDVAKPFMSCNVTRPFTTSFSSSFCSFFNSFRASFSSLFDSFRASFCSLFL
mmetsp:Transcript_23203/g.50767  ORF Transcript_23203/g.50767 Transcript_23203/m.50767 type:complete len:85 (+) Transcript_23203:116-370(+)